MAENEEVLLPRFFKVFLSETSSESLALPLSYMEHLADPLPKTAKLQGSGGRDWTVSLMKIRDAVYFTDGWSKFVEDHELVDGEFLTFGYDGNRTFEVSLFGRSSCKEIRAVAETVEISGSDSEEEEELSVDVDDDSSFQEEEELSVDVDDDSSFQEEEEISQSLQPFNDEETDSDTAVFAGNINVESLTNPHFTTTLKNRIYELLIPANVVKQNKLRFSDTVKYIDEEGTLIGKRGKWSDDRVCFKGWDRICRRNRLKKNEDTVECELLHDRKKVHSIRIHVMRRAT